MLGDNKQPDISSPVAPSPQELAVMQQRSRLVRAPFQVAPGLSTACEKAKRKTRDSRGEMGGEGIKEVKHLRQHQTRASLGV